MSRIVSPPFEEEYDYDDDLDNIPDLPSHVIWISGICIMLSILFVQYCVLRCSKAVKTENITSVLFVGTLITFLLSVVSIQMLQSI